MNERIREARDGAKMTNTELARATGRSQGAVTQWLDGTAQSLKGETAALIERATGYRAYWLITGKGPKRVEDVEPQLKWDVLTSLEILGKSIEEVVDPGARASAVSMLTTYINDPSGNLDVLPLIAKRLSGERPSATDKGFWEGRRANMEPINPTAPKPGKHKKDGS
ncbi:helix-turn-helix domain-containing protein [Variovorax sp. RA8]|uniref:helix-turn-helix domain-containing protein n=1 Tax=Variovorax sp. (strain JCM 16519 / RA8) TaxID=662548 RepID=UPI0013A568A2|nr:helix-turn-helix transcriptional regulator [Variovorax sp. RA8]